jgi:hypothetical protein
MEIYHFKVLSSIEIISVLLSYQYCKVDIILISQIWKLILKGFIDLIELHLRTILDNNSLGILPVMLDLQNFQAAI